MITPTSAKSKQYEALGIDEIAEDIETVFNEVNSITTDGLPVVADGVTITGTGTTLDPLVAVGGGGGTTTTVNISSAQILAMGTTPIELLPALGSNEYYEVQAIRIEYNHNTTAYSGAFLYLWAYQNLDVFNMDAAIIKTTDDMVYVNTAPYPLFDLDGTYNYGGVQTLAACGLPVLFTTWDNTNPTLGDGTLRAIITYTVRTFGA